MKNIRQVIKRVFRIDEEFSISFTISVVQLVGESGKGLPCSILKIEKSALILGKKYPDLKCYYENFVEHLAKENPKNFPREAVLPRVVAEMFIEALLFQETCPALKNSWLRPCIY